ncbi:MAG: alpha-1,4-glucan--maltose-1-phosphate maltosyltransferase [Sphingobium sp.]
MPSSSIFLLSTDTPHALDLVDLLPVDGVDGLLWQSGTSAFDLSADEVAIFVAQCHTAGVKALLEISPGRFPATHELVALHPDLFAVRRPANSADPIDPRKLRPVSGEAWARLGAPDAVAILLEPVALRLVWLAEQGIQGFCLRNIDKASSAFLAALMGAVRRSAAGTGVSIIADTNGMSAEAIANLAAVGVNVGILPFQRWDRPDFVAASEFRASNPDLPLIANLAVGNSDLPAFRERVLGAAAVSDGVILPLDLWARGERWQQLVAQIMDLVRKTADYHGGSQLLSPPPSPLIAYLRAEAADMRQSRQALLVVANTDPVLSLTPEVEALISAAGAGFQIDADQEEGFPALTPGEIRTFTAHRAKAITSAVVPSGEIAYAQGDRLVLENIEPSVDGGSFAVKRVVGESVRVSATLFADGHEQLAAELFWKAADEDEWQHTRMAQLPNDLWEAAFPLQRLGRHEYFVEGWLDRFGGFRRDFAKKLDAKVAQPVDFAEGRALIDSALLEAQGDVRDQLSAICRQLDATGPDGSAATLLLSLELSDLMDAQDERPHRIRSTPQSVDAERLAARFSSWYEIFPRSQTDDPRRHGTFADVVSRLPAIRAMGFDTLYFPPIHPIGRTNRKGPNNSLTAGPDDPGSPYAIGAAEGGHDAIHPELGSFDDFAKLIDAAHAHGLEIALDFAIQCSPDHPWLREHPGWFAWRPDGSMKYAENPPKKYQDIVNVDFYGPDAVPGLWLALRDVVLLWVRHGVKTFRVDNPHTKPLPFWEWMIGEVRSEHPDVLFLAEAFTRPAMMYRLAKIGFSQSYTYFTWRDEKSELVDYITELTTTAPKEFYRPHFFVNTPDINPPFLQTSGRPGFRIRAVLAATLSGLFGVYSGFELCEAAAVPGKEEYLDSEKYEIRVRDWRAPGNIIADITMLNRLRRSYPALQTHLNTRFQVVHNDHIIYYAKPAPDGSDMILVMVSLDPHNAQEADFEIPLWELGLPDDGSVAVEDLAEGHRFRWYGKFQHIRLDPEQPYRIWRIAPGDQP